VARELGVTDQTLYNWRSKYSGMDVSDVKRLRALEEENRRLKTMVADLSLDKEALQAVIRKNGWSFHEKAARVNPKTGQDCDPAGAARRDCCAA
jgi:transposase-like protein